MVCVCVCSPVAIIEKLGVCIFGRNLSCSKQHCLLYTVDVHHRPRALVFHCSVLVAQLGEWGALRSEGEGTFTSTYGEQSGALQLGRKVVH